ncbi:MAG TPA: coproporphyrinogen-III oxidase family protein [Enhygromyxa sp.]|nr:coproporphyrinogen-III oxidase family protein [Enhygromyxa sp.]
MTWTPTPERWRAPVAADAARYSPTEVFAAGLRNHHIANTAYPIAHQRTFKPYRVARGDHLQVTQAGFSGFADMCLYVHVPFCETRCSFCEYTVVGKDQRDQTDVYVDALVGELELYDRVIGLGDRRIHGLDIGGGTPGYLSVAQIERILAAIHSRVDLVAGADISIETTPRLAAADPARLAGYRALGIQRISMGIQVIQPDLLRVLNRAQNGVEHHHRAVEAIRAAGFARLNLDLMYGFADQSLDSWRATLEHAIALAPEYITLYRMRYKLTRISHQAEAVTLAQIRPMSALAKQLLREAGYHANPGKTTYSRIRGDVGTSSYLARRVQTGIPYLGLGLGSQTFTHTSIAYNDGAAGKQLRPYLDSVAAERLPIQDLYDLPARQMMGKMCAVSFYFGEIQRAPFLDKFGVPLEQVFADEIELLLARGLMELREDALSLTDVGSAFVNGIIPLFAAPSIQQYLLERDPAGADDLVRNRKLALRVARSA